MSFYTYETLRDGGAVVAPSADAFIQKLDWIKTLSFSKQFEIYMNMYDVDYGGQFEKRILLSRAILDLINQEECMSGIAEDVRKSLKTYYEELSTKNNFYALRFFEWTFPEFKWHQHRHRHLYTDAHNVHKIVNPTVQMALHIIEKYPSTYTRPFDSEFFDVIENAEPFQEKFLIVDLFASISALIASHPHKTELTKRMMEEIHESEGLCITGHVTRLLNVVRGFTEFDIQIDNYESERARVFHKINKLVDLDNFLESVTNIVRNKEHRSWLFETGSETTMRILKDYTKVGWGRDINGDLYPLTTRLN